MRPPLFLSAACLFATPLGAQATYSTPFAATTSVPIYAQTAFGPQTTGGSGAVSLMGGTAAYGLQSSGGLPVLRCDYVGEAYQATLTGDFSLATATPGAVVASMVLGGTTISSTINNLLAGTPGASWDASATITCTAVGTNTASVLVGGELGPFQAVGNVYAFQPFNRGNGSVNITTSAGAFTFDLQRTFTNSANQMRIQTLNIYQTR